jgi:hypothetical protein
MSVRGGRNTCGDGQDQSVRPGKSTKFEGRNDRDERVGWQDLDHNAGQATSAIPRAVFRSASHQNHRNSRPAVITATPSKAMAGTRKDAAVSIAIAATVPPITTLDLTVRCRQ